MKKTMILLTIALLTFVMAATSALGVLPDGTTFAFQNADSTFTNSVTSTAAQGGNITNLSISQLSQASYWHAFYGDVVKTILLADSGATNTVYNWGAQNLAGWVYFANASNVNWATVAAGIGVDRTAEDTELGLTGNVESVTNTLTLNSHNIITDIDGIGGIIAANAALGVNTSNSAINDWSTVLLKDSTTSAAIYAGEVRQGINNYAGIPVDYQIMVPVALGTGLRTYNVYAGLN